MNKKLKLNNKIITSLEEYRQVETYLYESQLLSVDTEFMRERTYYPQLCLVQLATESISVCLDPLALDITVPLADLLENNSITKILHSASQDIEVLGRYCDAQVNSLFDTQLAAEFAGISDQIGYSSLVDHLLEISLPKSQTRSNWAKRPLTSKQIEYSLNDVRYLIPMYRQLNDQLVTERKYDWYKQEQNTELKRMSDFDVAPDLAYKNFRASHRLDSKAQQLVKSLANWREHEAQSIDKPKHWIIKDSTISQIAEQTPKNKRALEAILVQDVRFKKKYLQRIHELLNQPMQKIEDKIWLTKKQLTEAQKQDMARLKKKITRLAEKFRLPPTRLGTRKDMVEYIQTGEGRLSRGWRAEVLEMG